MRILKFLLTSGITFAVCAALVFFLGREALLVAGSSMVRSALSTTQAISMDNLQYARLCRAKGGSGQKLVNIAETHIRFINHRQFVTEVVCDQFSSEPIVIKNYTLPPFVMKRPGSAGIIWGVERSGVELEVFGRRRIISVQNEAIETYPSGAVSLGITPQSTCGGYGYMCCQQETLSGVGTPNPDVTDCPRACYSQCLPRPIVLSLNTDPYPDEVTRSVKVLNGDIVTFTFVAAYAQQDPVTFTLDFGDGQKENFTALTGKTTHVYSCANSGCEYTAQLTAETSQGIESAQTAITQVKVVIE